VTSGHSGVSIGVASEHGKLGVQKYQTDAAPSRCSCAAVRGLEVSLCSFTQNEFIKCEIGNSSAKSLVLLLQPLQLFELICPHAALLLATTIIRLFRNLDVANSIYPRLALPYQHINLA